MDLSRLAPAHLDLRPMSSIATKVHKAIMKAYFNDKGLNKNEIFKLLEVSKLVINSGWAD